MTHTIGETNTPIGRAYVLSPCGKYALLAQRILDCKNNGGLWELPGGKEDLSKQEGIIGATTRETREEVRKDNLIVYDRPLHVHSHTYTQDGQLHTNVTLTSLMKAEDTEFEPNAAEVAQARWVPTGELLSYPLTPAATAAIRDFTQFALFDAIQIAA